MRTRLIATVAVLAAALLGPSAAFADVLTLDQPASPTASPAVTLQWTDIAGVDAYRVFRADADCTTGLTNISNLAGGDVLAGPPPTKTFPDTLSLAGTYCYFLRSVTGLVESPDSNHVLVTYDTDFPSASIASPANGAVLTNSNPITVTSSDAADATSGVQSVQFFASPAGLGSWTTIGLAITGPPYSVAWSPSDGTYDLKATVTDNVGHSTDSAPVLGVLVDGTAPLAPAAPTGVSPVNSAPSILFTASTDPGGVNASGVDHYDVLRDNLKVNASAITGAGPFTWTDNAVQSLDPASGSHGYSYTVVAVDAAGNQSAASGALQIVMDSTAPTTPVAPTGASPVGSAPSISFTATIDPLAGGVSSGVDHYDVYRDGVEGQQDRDPGGRAADVDGQREPVLESCFGLGQLRVHSGCGRRGRQSVGAVAPAHDRARRGCPEYPGGAERYLACGVGAFDHGHLDDRSDGGRCVHGCRSLRRLPQRESDKDQRLSDCGGRIADLE